MIVLTEIKQQCIAYQSSPKLKQHLKYTISIFLICFILRIVTFNRSYHEIYDQIKNSNNTTEDENQQQITAQMQIYHILSELLDFFATGCFILMIVQISGLIMKSKEKQKLNMQELLLFNDNQNYNSCSIQILGSQENQVQSALRPQMSDNSISQTNLYLSRLKSPKELHVINEDDNDKLFSQKQITNCYQDPKPRLSEKISEQPTYKTIQVYEHNNEKKSQLNSEKQIEIQSPYSASKRVSSKQSTQDNIIYSLLMQRALKLINGQQIDIHIIQVCKKSQNCKFFWISVNPKQSFCIQCDQNNTIENTKIPEEKCIEIIEKKKNLEDPIQQELILQEQLNVLKKNIKYNIKKCENYEFCQFFWIYQYGLHFDDWYCQSCNIKLIPEEEQKTSIPLEIYPLCTLCQMSAQSYFLTNCLHAYHYQCIEELIKKCLKLNNITCIACKQKLTPCLRQQKMIPEEHLNQIFMNQIEQLTKTFCHIGIEDLQ